MASTVDVYRGISTMLSALFTLADVRQDDVQFPNSTNEPSFVSSKDLALFFQSERKAAGYFLALDFLESVGCPCSSVSAA
jgi:hypothetical protein